MSFISDSISSAQPSTSSMKLNKRVLVASLTGSAIEWFDYFLYGTVASLVFNKLFFPNYDPMVGLMLTYLSFSLTFFVRPFGGFLFSHIGDRIGRKKTLVITLSLMGFATFGIGLLPGYDVIGIWAPILLIILRVIQGLGISGEWGGALLLAYEYAPKGKRGLYGSVPQMGVPLGMVMATLAMTLVSLLPDEDFLSWGWRIPFLLSAVLVLLGLWIRNGIDETPDFKEAKRHGDVAKVPLVDTLKYHWREVLIATGAKVVETAPFYVFTTFVVGYATGTLQLEKMSVLNAVSIASLITVFMIPLMGSLSDRIGRKAVFFYGALAMGLFAAPYYLLLDMRSDLTLTIATVIVIGFIWAPIVATLGTFMSEIFSTRVRYTGITLGSQLGAAIAGGSAPLIATWLQMRSDGHWGTIAIYIALCAAISIFAVSRAGARQSES